MCKYVIVYPTGNAQCGLSLQQGCPPEVKTNIRQAFHIAAANKYPGSKTQLGIAGGPPNCMFYNNPFLDWKEDCPEYIP